MPVNERMSAIPRAACLTGPRSLCLDCKTLTLFGRELEERLIDMERLEEQLVEYENELLQMASLINP
jgi:hypothetical protein